MATTFNGPTQRGGHLVFVIVLTVHALLLSSQVATDSGGSALRSGILTVLSPIQYVGDGLIDGTRRLWNGYIDLRGVHRENEELRQKVARLEQALWLERDAVASHRRLSEVLRLANQLPDEAIVAEVIGMDASTWFRTITVNQGFEQGVALNGPVVSASGLVGRVVSVGSSVAQVQLLSDRESAVGVLLSRTRVRGLVNGTGSGDSPTGLELKYISNLEDVSKGDLIMTSGMDDLYYKGLAVGRVATVPKRTPLVQDHHRRAGGSPGSTGGGLHPTSVGSGRAREEGRVRLLDILLAVGAAFVIQTVFGRYIPLLNDSVDLFTVVTAAFGLTRGRMPGLVTGSVGGLIQDAFSGGLLGLNGLSKSTVGYLAGLAQQHLIIPGATGRLLFFVAASLTDLMILAIVGYAAEVPTVIGEGLAPLAVCVGNALAGLFIVRMMEKKKLSDL